MPPFVNTHCSNCSKLNRFDLAELRKEGGSLFKEVLSGRENKSTKEFTVTCQHCGRKFKLTTIKGGDDGKKK